MFTQMCWSETVCHFYCMLIFCKSQLCLLGSLACWCAQWVLSLVTQLSLNILLLNSNTEERLKRCSAFRGGGGNLSKSSQIFKRFQGSYWESWRSALTSHVKDVCPQMHTHHYLGGFNNVVSVAPPPMGLQPTCSSQLITQQNRCQEQRKELQPCGVKPRGGGIGGRRNREGVGGFPSGWFVWVRWSEVPGFGQSRSC